jgi:hypothetical protein
MNMVKESNIIDSSSGASSSHSSEDLLPQQDLPLSHLNFVWQRQEEVTMEEPVL